jgi:DNA-directed RNA polymerase subunit RPC12/RpoP
VSLKRYTADDKTDRCLDCGRRLIPLLTTLVCPVDHEPSTLDSDWQSEEAPTNCPQCGSFQLAPLSLGWHCWQCGKVI